MPRVRSSPVATPRSPNPSVAAQDRQQEGLQRRTAAQLRPENSALFRAFDARQEFGEVPFKLALLVAATTTATSCFGDSEAVFRMLRRWES